MESATAIVRRDAQMLLFPEQIPKRVAKLFDEISAKYLILPNNFRDFFCTVKEAYCAFFDTGFSEKDQNAAVWSMIDEENKRILEEFFQQMGEPNEIVQNVIAIYNKQYTNSLYDAVNMCISVFSQIWGTQESFITVGDIVLYEDFINGGKE